MNTRKLSAFAGKYKYVLIILLAGLILLLLPGGSRTKAEPAAAQPIDTQTQTIQTEEQPVTREQIAVILTQYMFHVLKMERTWTPADLSTFPDGANVSGWAKEAMQDAVALGLINGTKASDGVVYLDPQGSAARQQVATILMNFCQNVKK